METDPVQRKCRRRQGSTYMSAENIDKKVLVDLQIEKSYSTMEDCELMASKERWSGAASRLYYAVFHAVCALLIYDGHRVKTHKGAGITFSQQYIHTGKLPTIYGELFYQLENMRERSDYDCFYTITENELKQKLSPAKEMINTIAEMVRE